MNKIAIASLIISLIVPTGTHCFCRCGHIGSQIAYEIGRKLSQDDEGLKIMERFQQASSLLDDEQKKKELRKFNEEVMAKAFNSEKLDDKEKTLVLIALYHTNVFLSISTPLDIDYDENEDMFYAGVVGRNFCESLMLGLLDSDKNIEK